MAFMRHTMEFMQYTDEQETAYEFREFPKTVYPTLWSVVAAWMAQSQTVPREGEESLEQQKEELPEQQKEESSQSVDVFRGNETSSEDEEEENILNQRLNRFKKLFKKQTF